MPDERLIGQSNAVIVRCMSPPSRRGAKPPSRTASAVHDKFRFDVVASPNIRIAHQKSAIITDLRVSNPIVRSDLPSSIDDLYPVLKRCIRDISKIHSKVANITGK